MGFNISWLLNIFQKQNCHIKNKEKEKNSNIVYDHVAFQRDMKNSTVAKWPKLRGRVWVLLQHSFLWHCDNHSVHDDCGTYASYGMRGICDTHLWRVTIVTGTTRMAIMTCMTTTALVRIIHVLLSWRAWQIMTCTTVVTHDIYNMYDSHKDQTFTARMTMMAFWPLWHAGHACHFPRAWQRCSKHFWHTWRLVAHMTVSQAWHFWHS
jgi:hypothetical protein